MRSHQHRPVGGEDLVAAARAGLRRNRRRRSVRPAITVQPPRSVRDHVHGRGGGLPGHHRLHVEDGGGERHFGGVDAVERAQARVPAVQAIAADAALLAREIAAAGAGALVRALPAAAANAAGEALLARPACAWRGAAPRPRPRRSSRRRAGTRARLVVGGQQLHRIGVDALDRAAAGLPAAETLAARAAPGLHVGGAVARAVDARAQRARRLDAARIAALRGEFAFRRRRAPRVRASGRRRPWSDRDSCARPRAPRTRAPPRARRSRI